MTNALQRHAKQVDRYQNDVHLFMQKRNNKELSEEERCAARARAPRAACRVRNPRAPCSPLPDPS